MAQTLCEMFQATAAEHADRPALAMAGHRGWTWAQYAALVRRLAPVFADLGARRGQPVALALGPSPEFHVVDTALMHAGAVPYSLQARDTVARDVESLRLAGARIVVTDAARAGHVREVAERHGGLDRVVVVGGPAVGDREASLADLLARTTTTDFDGLWKAVGPEDIATLIFTSGTTGAPKAVQLSHRAFVAAERGTDALAPVTRGGDVLSYLPLNHTAERFMGHYAGMAFGLTVHCVADPARLYDEIRRVRPTRFFGIPRVYEKLADRARAIVDGSAELAAALEASRARVRAEQAGRTVPAGQARAADRALEALAPVRSALGLDRVEFLGVATAPSSASMLEFFLALGLRVSDLWGLSEIIMCTLNPPGDIRLGTVGRFLPGIEGRVSADGEIQVRGPHAFSGYLGNPELTAAAMDREGWVSTGDLGLIDDGYLHIRGRRKEMLITSGGLNIAPAAVESALKDASPVIAHALAVADGRRFVTALVALDPEQLTAFAARHGRDGEFRELAALPEVRDEVAAAVATANTVLAGPERIRGFWVSPAPWVPGSDELTPTAKLRRDEIARKYAAEIDGLYAAAR